MAYVSTLRSRKEVVKSMRPRRGRGEAACDPATPMIIDTGKATQEAVTQSLIAAASSSSGRSREEATSKNGPMRGGATSHSQANHPPPSAELHAIEIVESSGTEDDEVLYRSYNPGKESSDSSMKTEELPIQSKRPKKAQQYCETNSDDQLASSWKRKPKMSGRLRNLKFSHGENRALIEALVPVYEKLLGKYAAKSEPKWKRRQWKKIIAAVNAVGIFPRSEEHVKKRYQDIKGTLKKKMAQTANEWTKVGGRFPKNIDLLDYELLLLSCIDEESMSGILQGLDAARQSNGDPGTLHLPSVREHVQAAEIHSPGDVFEDVTIQEEEEEEDSLESLSSGQQDAHSSQQMTTHAMDEHVYMDLHAPQPSSQQITTHAMDEHVYMDLHAPQPSSQPTRRGRNVCHSRERLRYDQEQSESESFHTAHMDHRGMLERSLNTLHEDLQNIHNVLVDYTRFKKEYMLQKLEILRSSSSSRTIRDPSQGNGASGPDRVHPDERG